MDIAPDPERILKHAPRADPAESDIDKVFPSASQATWVAGKKPPVRNFVEFRVGFRSLAERSTDTPKQHVIDRHVGSKELTAALTTASATASASASEESESGVILNTLAVLVDADCIPRGLDDLNVLKCYTRDVAVLRVLELDLQGKSQAICQNPRNPF